MVTQSLPNANVCFYHIKTACVLKKITFFFKACGLVYHYFELSFLEQHGVIQ